MKAVTREPQPTKPQCDGRAATALLAAHDKSIETFVCWQKGSRAQLVASVSAALKAASTSAPLSDISHLSDAPVFECGKLQRGAATSVETPGVCPQTTESLMFGSASRREHIRQRVSHHSPEELVLMYKDLGACAIPAAVMELLSKGGTSGGAVMALPQMWQGSVTTFQATKPPSRADAVAVASAMQFMHKAVDAAYDGSTKQQQIQLRSILKEPVLPCGLAATLAGAEEKWLLEHLAIVDIGFAELIRQVKVQCLERGALLNHIRETFFDYLGDFLSSEKAREANISRKEQELQEASQRFADTCAALDEAKETIASLEAEVRRLETLQKYTVAKHIRDKQRLTRKHEVRRNSKDKGQEEKVSGSGTAAASCPLSGSDEEDADGTLYDDDDVEDTLSAMVRRKREEEPKLRRASMAKPLLVPSQFPHVRDRPRARAVERVDASIMTDPVFFRSKLPEPPKPTPPPVEPRPRRDRLASVSLAKDVTHHYTQTEPMTPRILDLPAQRASDEANAPPRGGTDSDPPAPGARRGSIVQSNATLQMQRPNAEEIRRRISMAKSKPLRSALTNAGVQASTPTCNAEVQHTYAAASTGTQTSVLLQLQASGALQQSLVAPGAVVSPSAPALPKKEPPGNTSGLEARRPSPAAATDVVRRTVSPDSSPFVRTISPESSYLRGGDTSVRQGQECVSPSQRSSTSSVSHGGKPRLATATQWTQTNPVVVTDPVAVRDGRGDGPNQIVVTSPTTSPRTEKSPRKAPAARPVSQNTARGASTRGGQNLGDGHVTKLPAIRSATPTTGRRTGAAAAAVAPLVESDLAASMESSSDSFSEVPVRPVSPAKVGAVPLVAQSTTSVAKTPHVGIKQRNVKWMVAAAAEVHLAAVQSKFGPSDDPSAIMPKHFRTKYGFEKVADGYVKDFQHTLDAFVATVGNDPTSSTSMPCMGTYQRHAGGDSTQSEDGALPSTATVPLVLHRRLYAYTQFMFLSSQPPPSLVALVPANKSFHMRGYLFYLHVLEAFRARGGKAFLKELTDDVCVRITPRIALSTLEHALRDRLALPLLELYLLAVQGAMMRYDADPLSYDPTVASLLFPHNHVHFTSVRECTALVHLTDQTAAFNVPLQFLTFEGHVVWDLDLLLEMLVVSYDAVVRPLITASQQMLANGSL